MCLPRSPTPGSPWPTWTPSWSVAARARSPACGSAWRPRRPTVTRSASRCTACAASTRSACDTAGRGAGGHRRPPPRGVLGALPRRGARRRPCGQRTGRRARRRCTRSPAHPSTRRCSACRASRRSIRRRRAWCARSPTGRAEPAPLVPLYLRRPDAKPLASAVTSMTVAYDALTRRRRRAVRGTGGAAVRRRRPVAGARRSWPSSKRQAQPLRRRPRRRQAGRLRRHLPARPKAALRVRDSHHRRRPRIPGPGHRPADAGRSCSNIADGGVGLPGGAHRQRGRDRAVRERRASSTSACAGGTTGSAAPTPTPCATGGPQ